MESDFSLPMDSNFNSIKGMILSLLLFLASATGNIVFGQYMEGFRLVGNSTGLSSVNPKELRGIFSGSRSLWTTGEQVIVVMPSSRCDYALLFSETVLQLSYPGLQKYWLGLVFQGRAAAPVFLPGSKEILEYVRDNPGAIGIIMGTEKDISPELLISIVPR